MGTSHRRRRRALGAAVAFTALMLGLLPDSANADTTVNSGPIPADVLDEFASCPPADAFVTQNPQICLKVRAYDGEIKIGNTVARVDSPIEMTVGIGWGADADGNLLAEVVPGRGAGAGSTSIAPIQISGGILGLPELDSLLQLDPTGLVNGLLGVGATPQLGSVAVGVQPGQDPVSAALQLLGWLTGVDQDVSIEFPLGIKISNLLFGNKCEIPGFTMNLTNGTTTPPAGIEPMTGDYGDSVINSWDDGDILERRGARLVDNTFAVSGAGRCDLLVGDLLDQPTGLLDSVISGQVGLPSPAGRNYAAFSIDTTFISYFDGLLRLSGDPVDFGSVPVGSTATRTVTLRSTGTHAAVVGVGKSTVTSFGFSIVDNRCDGLVLKPGDECQVDVAYTPLFAGFPSNGQLEVRNPLSSILGKVRLSGIGAP